MYDDLYILYNTLTEGKALLKKDLLRDMKNSMDNIPNNILNEMKKCGIIVPIDVKENRIFSVNHNKIKFSTKECFLMIYTTYRCNMRCTYCYEDFLSNTKNINKDLDFEMSDKIIKFIKKLTEENGFKEINILFFGGEPLLNQDPIFYILRELTPWAKELNINLSNGVTTNGTINLGQNIDKFSKQNTFFQFTLDGPEEIHNARRPYISGEGTFSDIIENLRLCEKHGIDYGVRINIDKSNARYIEDLFDYLKDEFNAEIKLKISETVLPVEGDYILGCPWAAQCFMGQEPETLLALIDKAREKGFTVLIRPLRDWTFCEFLREHSYIIDPFGDVYKCEGFVGMEEHKAGTIKDDGGLEKFFPMYDWVSINPIETECRDCKLLPACGGGCPCLIYESKNRYHKGGCITFKKIHYAKIKYYLESEYPQLF